MLFWFHGDSRCSPVDPIHDDVTGELEVPMEDNPEPWRIHPGSGPTLDLQGIDQKIPDLDFFWFDIWPTLLTLHWYHTITNYPMPLNTLFQIPTGVANHIRKTDWPENPCRIGWASEFPPLTGNSVPPAWWNCHELTCNTRQEFLIEAKLVRVNLSTREGSRCLLFPDCPSLDHCNCLPAMLLPEIREIWLDGVWRTHPLAYLYQNLIYVINSTFPQTKGYIYATHIPQSWLERGGLMTSKPRTIEPHWERTTTLTKERTTSVEDAGIK